LLFSAFGGLICSSLGLHPNDVPCASFHALPPPPPQNTNLTIRASPVVLSTPPCKHNFSHPSLIIYLFATPPIKPKLGQQVSGGLLIANHLD